MGLRPANPSWSPCQWVMAFSPSFQQSRMICPSTSQGKSSSPIFRSFTCTPMESISARASLARCSALARSALRRASGTMSRNIPPLRKTRCCRACCSASASSTTFLALMAVRSRDSSTGNNDWASSRVKVRSAIGLTYFTAPGLFSLRFHGHCRRSDGTRSQGQYVGHDAGGSLVEVPVPVALQDGPLHVFGECPQKSVGLRIANLQPELRVKAGSDGIALKHLCRAGLHREPHLEQQIGFRGRAHKLVAACALHRGIELVVGAIDAAAENRLVDSGLIASAIRDEDFLRRADLRGNRRGRNLLCLRRHESA